MSDKQNVIIEADDITIVQGEKVKDYNVRVTDEKGQVSRRFPITIAFYNKDYSFSKDVTTDKYGIASVPLYLTGDSWKVDVHFKGNEEYLPNIITREITIQKFERKMTYIESENLHLNEDDVVSTDEGWYTVYLYDEDDMPVQFEPVSFNIVSTKNDVDDVDFILKTDENGKIIVPYLTHNDTIVITVDYKGCTRYSSFTKADVVSFDDIADRTDVSFRTDNEYLEIKKGNGNWQDIWTAEDTVERVIVNYPNDDRTVHDGMLYYYAMNSNVYQVTLFYKGNDNYFSKCETLTFDKPNDSRVTLWQWIELQTGELPHYELVDNSNQDGGKLNTITLTCLYELPSELVYMGYTKGSYTGTYEFEVKGLPRYDVQNNNRISIVEYDIVNPLNVGTYIDYTLSFYLKQNDYIKNGTDPTADILICSNSFSFHPIYNKKGTLSLTGFGYQNNAYQNLTILAHNDSAISYDKVNEFALLKLLNTDTLEQFYFYSYLDDNVTATKMNFVLGLGNWDLDVVSKEYDEYGGDFYQTSAIISNEDVYENIVDFFFNIDNWNEYGLEEITIENETIYAPQTNDLIAITDEFTDSNTYTLYWNATFGTNSVGSMLIGADETGSTMLAIRKGNITLVKNDIIIDEKTITDNISGNWKMVRNGNTWELYHNGELLYTTNELIYNTFGLMGGLTTITGLFVENTPSADITPSVNDYDGSVYGSDLHLEVRQDHINLYDYGMLPTGAITGAKVIVDNVPINATNLGLELEMRYNNTRYERLNNLTGKMQMKIYEDISTTDSVKDYARVMCSPMVVPNVETVFTRHSEEGILYYVKDPRMVNSNEFNPTLDLQNKNAPTYLCNAYNQYKGGVEIKTETGISLFNLDNAYSPVYIGNNLVRAEFHRRSGYVKISRWNEFSNSWATVNILKLKNTPQLSLVRGYNDDYAEVKFGNTTWKFYRGRPFIVVNHPNDDLRILNLVDRVYCEIIDNNRSMGFIEEKDAVYGIFEPQLSIQQFKQELHIGQNVRLDNFEVYDIENNNDVGEISENSNIELTSIDRENAIQINKNTTDRIGLNFPSSSTYVKRVGNKDEPSDFSLLIGNIITTGSADDTMQVTIKARGFDERGAIPVDGASCQYGIWEQSQTVDVDTLINDEIRVSFTECPSTVKYIDFVIILEAYDDITVTINDLMYYEGKDIEINHQEDTSEATANAVNIVFSETYYANLYNEDDSYGLSVIRPQQETITLRSIGASEETVLVPYIKRAKEWDKPNQVFLEYLNARQQVIDIDWEN